MFSVVKKVYNYYYSPDKDLARELKSILGFTPARLHLYKTAFSHKSLTVEDPKMGNNERLEYLGDAILSTVVAEYLYKKYPKKDEGFLTKMRSKIVKRKTLNEIADKMELDTVLSKYCSGKVSRSMLGNCLEAVVGAIYLEFGYNKTKRYVIKKILNKYLDIHQLESYDDNFKSQLLEWSQKKNKKVVFETIEKTKVNNRDMFKVAVKVDDVQKGIASGFNKKNAEQKAAQIALKTIPQPEVEA